MLERGGEVEPAILLLLFGFRLAAAPWSQDVGKAGRVRGRLFLLMRGGGGGGGESRVLPIVQGILYIR